MTVASGVIDIMKLDPTVNTRLVIHMGVMCKLGQCTTTYFHDRAAWTASDRDLVANTCSMKGTGAAF